MGRNNYRGISGKQNREYVRKGNTIFKASENGGIERDENGDPIVVESFPSNNKAKKKSFEMQKSAAGGMGSGLIVVL